MEAAMLCKVKNQQCRETCGESNTGRSKNACTEEAHESARKRLERTLPKGHEDRIARKGFDSLSHYNLAQIYPDASSTENTRCHSSGEQRMGKTRKFASMASDQSKEQKEVIEDARTGQRTVHFAALMDICKRMNSMTHCSLVHKFTPMPQAF